jgi:transcriptional regulator with XRE-family HTH domain
MPFIAGKRSSAADEREMSGEAHDADMTVRQRREERAVDLARTLAQESRTEVRRARVAAGLSRSDVGRAVGISASQVDRFERGVLRDIRLEQLCRLSVAVGLVPSLRFFPDGDPLRDAGQLRVLGRLQARLPATVRLRTEVPLFGRQDLRAWDAVVDGTGCLDAFEIETRIADLQAIERRVMLKLRDDQTIQHLFLVIADTRWNRQALAAGRGALRGDFPLDTRSSLASLGAGRCPGANGMILL